MSNNVKIVDGKFEAEDPSLPYGVNLVELWLEPNPDEDEQD